MTDELQIACDKVIVGLYEELLDKQEEYRHDKPAYFQGLLTSALPKDGGKEAPDLKVKPTNQAEDWQAFGVTFPAQMECAVRVDVYDGPVGEGWILRGFVEAEGKKYSCAVNRGPEDRDEAWGVSE